MESITAITPIWLDCDTGHDDAFAIILAACDPQSKLLGISTVHGNASLKHTTYNTSAVLEAIGRSDVAVLPGHGKPLKREACYAEGIHGDSGLDGTTLLPKPIQNPVFQDIKAFLGHIASSIMKEKPQTVWIVATGALTNIYMLFTSHPHLIDHIKGLSVMGGSIGNGFTDAPLGYVKGSGERFGNWTPFAEFNIYCDPEAAKNLFEDENLARKTTLITLDLTHRCLTTKDIQAMLLTSKLPDDATRRPIRQMMNQLLNYFADTYWKHFGLPAPPLHDPLAVFAALCPHLFVDNQGMAFDISVVTEGQRYDRDIDKLNELGRTIIRGVGINGVRIPTGVDFMAFWRAIDRALGIAETCL